MKLEQQVVSLELAKKLKELGFKQESLFVWVITISGYIKLERFIETGKQFEDVFGTITEMYSAYTVAELGEMLPLTIKINGIIIMLKCSKRDIGWSIRYVQAKREGLTEISELADTEADARAKMLIYLKENNLI